MLASRYCWKQFEMSSPFVTGMVGDPMGRMVLKRSRGLPSQNDSIPKQTRIAKGKVLPIFLDMVRTIKKFDGFSSGSVC